MLIAIGTILVTVSLAFARRACAAIFGRKAGGRRPTAASPVGDAPHAGS